MRALLSDSVKTPAAVIDSFETTPEYAALREALQAQSWPRMENELVRMPPVQAGVAITQLGEIYGVEAFLERSITENPQSALARTALAARYVTLAWAARSRKHAENVSGDEIESFFAWLTRAEDLLEPLYADAPDCAPAWSVGLYTARGMQLGENEVWRRYNALAALSPNDYPAQIQLLQFILPKWFGSWEQAERSVHKFVTAAPNGSSSHALVALLHIERWTELSGDEQQAHMRKPEVLEELRAAASALLRGTAHLDPVSVQAHNAFVMAFWLGDHAADAAPHVRLLQGRASEFPWRYVSGTPKKITEVHRYLLGEKRGWFRR